MLFVNLAVKDLAKTKTFFAALGFTFNPQFTDDNAACMVVNDTGAGHAAHRAVLQGLHVARDL